MPDEFTNHEEEHEQSIRSEEEDTFSEAGISEKNAEEDIAIMNDYFFDLGQYEDR